MPIEEQSMKGLVSSWGLGAKPCDSCNSSAALLFCRAHSAFLCVACDSEIHHAHAHAHERVWMCEVCEQAPAAVTCKADAAALCTSCDRDIHSANPLASRHHRLPVLPFYHTPASDLSVIRSSVDADEDDDDSWLIPNLQGNIAAAAADFMCTSEIDSFLDSGCHDFDIKIPFKEQQQQHGNNNRSYLFGVAGTDSVVPTGAKNGHGHAHGNSSLYKESCFEIDFTQSKLSPFNFSAQSDQVSSSDVGIVPEGNANGESSLCVTKSGGSAVQLSRIEREARVMRYKEKRKKRKFEKTIRYASRKAYAETRPRIKGRFARRSKDDEREAEQCMYKEDVVRGFFMEDDDMYGVVPSF